MTVRLSAADHAVLSAAAESAGVALGSLVRTAAVRYAAEIAGGAAPRARMRRAGASSEGRKPEVLRAAALAAPVSRDAADPVRWAMERQQRLNKAKGGGR